MNNWERLVWNQLDASWASLMVTIEVCLIAFALAVVGGLVLCLVRMYVRPLRPVAVLLIEFFRATPILVQLLWVTYAWPAIFGWPETFFAAAWTALALQSSGFLAETFRGGIEAIPEGVSIITVQDLMYQSQKIVNVWYEPIEILTATAAIYIVFIFLVSLAGKSLADSLRRRYGISAS